MLVLTVLSLAPLHALIDSHYRPFLAFKGLPPLHPRHRSSLVNQGTGQKNAHPYVRLAAQKRDRAGSSTSRRSKPKQKGGSKQGEENQCRAAASHGIKPGHTLVVATESLAGGSSKGSGSGVAKVDGLIIFVAGALPGAKVECKVTAVKRDYLEAGILQILSPSPDTTESPCPLFRSHGAGCGGCKLLGMTYEAQLREKQAQVDQVFASWAAENGTTVHQIIAAAPEDRLQHRNRVDFAASARAYLPPPEGGPAFGAEIKEAPPVARRVTGMSVAQNSEPSMFLGLRPLGAKFQTRLHEIENMKGKWRINELI